MKRKFPESQTALPQFLDTPSKRFKIDDNALVQSNLISTTTGTGAMMTVGGAQLTNKITQQMYPG